LVLDPKQQALLDQATSSMGELYPGAWWSIYQGCLEKGFNEEQTMKLLVAYIISQGSGDKRPG